MEYKNITLYTDKADGLKRIAFNCFNREANVLVPEHTSEQEIQVLISEVLNANPAEVSCLMTKVAMGRYLNLSETELDQLDEMAVGETINQVRKGTYITRSTANTYFGVAYYAHVVTL